MTDAKVSLAPNGALRVQRGDHPAVTLPLDNDKAMALLRAILAPTAVACISTAAAPTQHEIDAITSASGFTMGTRIVDLQCTVCGGRPKRYVHDHGTDCPKCNGAGVTKVTVTKLLPRSAKLAKPKLSLSDLFDDDEELAPARPIP